MSIVTGLAAPLRSCSLVQKRAHQELVEQWSAQPSHGIPTRSGVPPGAHDLGRGQPRVLAVGATPAAAALGDVGQGAGGARDAVQPRVQEPERPAAGGHEGIVDERDDGGKGRRRRRGAADGRDGAVVDDAEAVALGRDVGEAPAGGVVQAGEVVRAKLLVEVGRDSGVLVRRAREVVAEAARGKGHGLLRGQHVGRGGAHAGDVGAAGGEHGREARRLGPVVGLAGRPGPRVARREDDAHAPGAELTQHGADLLRVGGRELALVVGVRGAPGGGQLGVGQVEQVGDKFQVGLDRDLIRVRLTGVGFPSAKSSV